MSEMTSFLALLVLGSIHLFANHAKILGWLWHGRFLSFAGGVSFAYVFIDLLPMLEAQQPILKQIFEGIVFFLDRHVYVVALIGVLFVYGLQGSSSKVEDRSFWISMLGYALFNFLIGASLADPLDRSIQPIALFTFGIGLHYFVHDHNLRLDHRQAYEKYGRWVLAFVLLMGWCVGYFAPIPQTWIALAVAFVAGGVLFNVLRYELPKKEPGSYPYFVLGALLYTGIILSVGV